MGFILSPLRGWRGDVGEVLGGACSFSDGAKVFSYPQRCDSAGSGGWGAVDAKSWRISEFLTGAAGKLRGLRLA